MVNPPPYGRTALEASVKRFGTRTKLVALLFALTTLLGCGALDARSPSAQTSTGVVASSAIVDFGSVSVGHSAVRTNTITNNTKSAVVITHAQIDHSDFTVSGQNFPLTLGPGKSATLQITYTPQSGGNSESRFMLAINSRRFSDTFGLRGTAVLRGQIKLTPDQVSFGNVGVGKTASQSATISNVGRTPVKLTQAAISGQGYSLTGLTLPLTLLAGQSATVGVTFAPVKGGNSPGMISVVGSVSLTLPKRPFTLNGGTLQTVALRSLSTSVTASVSGIGLPAVETGTGQLAVSPSSIALGSVKIGATQTRSAMLINSGNADLTVRQATVTAKGFRLSGISFPLTLAAGQRKNFSVTFTPQAAGASTGSIAVTTDASDTVVNVPVSAVATSPGAIVSSPSSLGFGSVQVGKNQTLSGALTNTGGSTVTISQANISGNGFNFSGLNLPLTLAAGQSVPFSVTFSPQSNGSGNGALSFMSDASNGTLMVPLTGTVSAAGSLSAVPSSLNFGSVQTSAAKTVAGTLTNSGGSSVTISQASVSGSGFTMSGLNLPVTLSAGQNVSFNVTYTSQSSGSATGAVSFTSDATNGVLAVPLSASTPSVSVGALTSAPASLSFGSVPVSTPKTLSGTLTNSGGSSVTISQASVSGSGFTMSGLNLPVTLSAGQNVSFNVTYTSQSSGSATGAVSFTSDATNGVLAVPLSASTPSVGVGSIASAPASLNFGNVPAATPKTVSETLTNSGDASLTITQANVSGPGFSMTGLTLPVALAAGQSATFNVTFNPQSSGAASGNLSINSNGSNSTLNIPLTANVASAGVLSTSDSSLNFGSIPVNGNATQSETLTNSGGTTITVTQANVSGNGFSASGLNLPLTLTPGQSFTFAAKFNPAGGGDATGSISVVSDASDPSVTITLAGTATVAGQLAVSPATLDFGSVTVGQNKSLTATLTATGSSVTVSNAGTSTAEFTLSGLSLPLTLSAGKSATFTVTFKPSSSGAAAANASFTSNASNPSAQQNLTGTGAAAPQHSVALLWNASSSSVVGYNVYRGTRSGGPYAQITAMNPDTTFVDSTVQSGQTYFYVTRAVDGNGKESANSNQTQAVIPTP